MKTFVGVEAIVVFFVLIIIGMINRFIRAAFGVVAVCLAIIPVVLLFPNWELAHWTRQHAFSLLVVTFVIQLIYHPSSIESVTIKPPDLFKKVPVV